MTQRPAWKYWDSRGIEYTGAVIATSDFGGTDVVYTFKSTTGIVSVLSGALLKKAIRQPGTVDVPDSPTSDPRD